MIKMREITISTTREGSTHDNNATIHIEANNKPVEYMAKPIYIIEMQFLIHIVQHGTQLSREFILGNNTSTK